MPRAPFLAQLAAMQDSPGQDQQGIEAPKLNIKKTDNR
jgi:hypothetical protein